VFLSHTHRILNSIIGAIKFSLRTKFVNTISCGGKKGLYKMHANIDLQMANFVSRRDNTGKSTVVLNDSYGLGWLLRCVSVTCTGYVRVTCGHKIYQKKYFIFLRRIVINDTRRKSRVCYTWLTDLPNVDVSQKSSVIILHISSLKLSDCIIFSSFTRVMIFKWFQKLSRQKYTGTTSTYCVIATAMS